MQVEKGINPNCSELVARLNPWHNKEELKSLLRELEKATGWTVGYSDNQVVMEEGKFSVAAPVPVSRIKLGDVEDMPDIPYVNVGDIPIQGNVEAVSERLMYGASGIRRFASNSFWGRIQERPKLQKRIPLGLIPYRKPKIVSDPFGSHQPLVDPLDVKSNDGYDEHPALKAFQHPYEPHFKPLARAIRTFETTWHTHDGGSSEPFESWCRKNGFEDVASKHEL